MDDDIYNLKDDLFGDYNYNYGFGDLDDNQRIKPKPTMEDIFSSYTIDEILDEIPNDELQTYLRDKKIKNILNKINNQ